jgi:hypothetical protein
MARPAWGRKYQWDEAVADEQAVDDLGDAVFAHGISYLFILSIFGIINRGKIGQTRQK